MQDYFVLLYVLQDDQNTDQNSRRRTTNVDPKPSYGSVI